MLKDCVYSVENPDKKIFCDIVLSSDIIDISVDYSFSLLLLSFFL